MISESNLDWLPDLEKLSDHDGNWDRYLDAIYEIFRQDFVLSKPRYMEKRFALKRMPISEGKECTFWHIISSGKVEEEREVSLPRCERIRWPRPIIEALDTDSVRVWKNQRGRSERILIAPDDFSYVVILDDREDFVLLWTAYTIEEKHRRKKMEKDFKRWEKESQNG